MIKKLLRVPIGKFPQGARVVLRDKSFVIKASPNKLPYSRVGVVVGKNAIKRANKRNKTKRVIFKAFEKFPEILSKEGKDYLVIVGAKKNLDENFFEELTKELGNALVKIKIKIENDD